MRTASYEFRELDGFDARFDAFWLELIAQNPSKLMGVRDSRLAAMALRDPATGGAAVDRRRGAPRRPDPRLLRPEAAPPASGRPRSMKIVDFQTLEPDKDLGRPGS